MKKIMHSPAANPALPRLFKSRKGFLGRQVHKIQVCGKLFHDFSRSISIKTDGQFTSKS